MGFRFGLPVFPRSAASAPRYHVLPAGRGEEKLQCPSPGPGAAAPPLDARRRTAEVFNGFRNVDAGWPRFGAATAPAPTCPDPGTWPRY